MLKVIGVASAVTHSNERKGCGEYHESETCIATFYVQSVQVRFKSDKQPQINDGDLVAVAGTWNGALLNALAYRNHSTRKDGNVDKLSNSLAGLACLAIAAVESQTRVAVAVVFALFGAYHLICAGQIATAERELEDRAPTKAQQTGKSEKSILIL